MSPRTHSIHVARRATWRSRCTLALLLLGSAGTAGAAQLDIVGPEGSGQFGDRVAVLPNGNIVVGDPEFDGKGAVYLYSPTGTQISALFGSSVDDRIGADRIVVLSNGNYVIISPQWDNGVDAVNAGAVTWASATAGVSGVVSPENSLVGTSTNDGEEGISATALTNGNYVVGFNGWDNGPVVNAGAVVWCNGSAGRSGPVTTTIAVYGTTEEDQAGRGRVAALSNGNYVVSSSIWNNGLATRAGAVTWGNGTSGTIGEVSAANSLVGSTAEDRIGGRVAPLTNGNYVVASPGWDNASTVDAGAATWGSGNGGTIGPLTMANSLVGSTEGDSVGGSVTALSNGNYVVSSELWDNGPVQEAGAATFGNGSGGTIGTISDTNSLVGDSPQDFVGTIIVPLTNGNYVVSSPGWNDGATLLVGAATWGSGTSGVTGVVSVDNSLVGDTDFDNLGNSGIAALANGSYVVGTESWDGPLAGQEDVGAATFADGTSGLTGVVSPANSLIGVTVGDRVGRSIRALTNGNYVVASNDWDKAGVIDAGAVTWGDGTDGTIGVVSVANSLVGSTEGDQVGRLQVLVNGSYVVGTDGWDDNGNVDAGAVTWCIGTGPTSAVVSASNSLVGSSPDDRVGTLISFGTKEEDDLPAVNWVMFAQEWDDAPNVLSNSGAVTLGYGNGNPTGPITANNSVLGTVAESGFSLTSALDVARATLIVGRPASNIVTLFNQKLFADGFEAP